MNKFSSFLILIFVFGCSDFEAKSVLFCERTEIYGQKQVTIYQLLKIGNKWNDSGYDGFKEGTMQINSGSFNTHGESTQNSVITKKNKARKYTDSYEVYADEGGRKWRYILSRESLKLKRQNVTSATFRDEPEQFVCMVMPEDEADKKVLDIHKKGEEVNQTYKENKEKRNAEQERENKI